MNKIVLLFVSSIAFIFGDPALIENTDEIVKIHESHKIMQHDSHKA